MYGGYSSAVERQIVALDAVGSNPTTHPIFLFLPVAGAADTQPALGCSQVVRHGTLTPAFAGSSPATPAKHDPLAQLAEHLTFNQGVWSSNLQWVTICLLIIGRAGMAEWQTRQT